MSNFLKIICFTAILPFLSCKKDFERPNWDVDLLAPLVRTTLTTNDLLPDSTIASNLDESLKLVYQTNIFELSLDSLLNIPNLEMADTFNSRFSVLAEAGDSLTSENRETELVLSEGIELTQVIIESGFFEMELFSEIQGKLVASIVIPSATKNGDTLIINGTIDAGAPSSPSFNSIRVDLSGYELNLTGSTGDSVNTFVSRVSVEVDANEPQFLITGGEEMILTGRLVNLVPAYAKGFFGNMQINTGSDLIELDVFNRISGGSLDIDQLDVSLNFENGVGADAEIAVNQFETINTETNITSSLNHTIMNSPVTINRSQETYSVPEVTYTNNNIAINTTNSNIDELIEIFPNQLLYNIDLEINPMGNVSAHNDFVFKDHLLKTTLNLEFPLSIITNNLTLIDTVDLSLNSDNLNGEIIAGNLVLHANNGYPFDANIELELFDSENNPISKIVSTSQIKSALLNTSLVVSENTKSIVTYELSEKNIEDLYVAKKIGIKVSFTSVDQNQFVKIFDNYSIDIQLVGDFSYNYNSQ